MTLSFCYHNPCLDPHGCMSSAFLFTFYTDDCQTGDTKQYNLKYSDDTDKGEAINCLCSDDNVKKNVKIVFGSQSDSHKVTTNYY